MKRLIIFLILMTLAAVWTFSCGSGVEGDNNDAEYFGEEGVATLSGLLYYDGTAVGDSVIIGLMDQWPVTGPPKEFIEVEIPEAGFPFFYSIPLSYTGDFFLAAFLDVDPMDGVAINVDLDPMHVPASENDWQDILEGQNEKDFVIVDPQDVDWWW